MKIAVTGATGLVGSALCAWALHHGHQVIRLTRTPTLPTDIEWGSNKPVTDRAPFLDVDYFVNLAGAPIAAARWSRSVKQGIINSRVDGTRNIVELISQLPQRPGLIQASATGFYGSTGDAGVDETSPAGTGFLPEVCSAWEQEALPVRGLGSPLAILRLGMVLAATGGALQKMLPVFRLGLGGRLGDGMQYMSWISLADVVQAIAFCLEHRTSETCNLVSPSPVRNKEFTQTLAQTLNRPAVLPVPAFALKLALGQMADDLLLANSKVLPKTLLEKGFSYTYPTLPQALQVALELDPS